MDGEALKKERAAKTVKARNQIPDAEHRRFNSLEITSGFNLVEAAACWFVLGVGTRRRSSFVGVGRCWCIRRARRKRRVLCLSRAFRPAPWHRAHIMAYQNASSTRAHMDMVCPSAADLLLRNARVMRQGDLCCSN